MQKDNSVQWSVIFAPRSILFTISGVLFAVFGLQGFMVPNNFLDGGVTGISILVKAFADIHISFLLIIFNIPFLIIGFRKIGRTFGIQAAIAMLLLSALMYVVHIPVFTTDKVLIAVFGGFFIGLGIGLVMKGGGVIDGLEVIAQYTERKSAFTAGEIILTLNTLIIIGAALKFGVETGMYSILVYFTAMKTTNYVVDGFEEFTSMHIVSAEYEKVKEMIVKDFGKGITVYKGQRGFLPGSFQEKYDCEIVMTVVTRLEIFRINRALEQIDPKAFVYIISIRELKGGTVIR